MAAYPLLSFQRKVLNELLDQDALCIIARGLGMERILAELCRVCSTRQALVFLINASDEDEDRLKHSFMQMRSGEGVDQETELAVVKNETNSSSRAQLYRTGGLISVTSRILIVDLLNGLVPAELVTGAIVCNASRITAESIEAFVLRVIQQQSPQSFVKALSDAPEAFTLGFAPLEKTLKVLGLRHVHLWPRFQVDIQKELAAASAPVVELRQPLTRAMVELQQAALDCVSATISELCSSAKVIDQETVNVESSLFRFFDAMVKRQLQPYWHRLSARIRGMVTDLALLRHLTELITVYDCVSLQKYLDTLLLSSRSMQGAMSSASSGSAATWLASDSANILFAVSRSRVFRRLANNVQMPLNTKDKLRSLGLPENIVPVLEVPPKLQLLAQILNEIGATNCAATRQGKDSGPVLIMAGSSRECRLIRSYLASLHETIRFDIPETTEDDDCCEHPRMMIDLLQGFFRWKAHANSGNNKLLNASRPSSLQNKKSLNATNSATQPYSRNDSRGSGSSSNSRGGGQTHRAPPPSKRRRVRGASTAGSGVLRAPAEVLEQESAELAASVKAGAESHNHSDAASRDALLGFGIHETRGDQHETAALDAANLYLDEEDADWAEALETFDESFGILPKSETIAIYSYSSRHGLLESLRPTHIVMYDPEPAFIRDIELYQTLGAPLKQVYFLVYDNSIEEQRYLSAIRRERESFEKLIRDKSTLVIPINSSIASSSISPSKVLLNAAIASRSHRNARDSSLAEDDEELRPTIVVDTREFRSPLPSLLHAAGFCVVPRTIDIGDYILHDNLAIERKSLPDLIGSLRSGRLYNQAEAMIRHYAYAALLIEFEVNTSFSLQAMGGVTADIQIGSINSQLAMLVLAFPRLRIIWSSSPYETVNIFVELKRNAQEPDIERAVAMGTDDTAVERESIYSQSPVSLLQSLPGVNLRNYQKLAGKYKNICEICKASKKELEELLGSECAAKLYDFLHLSTTD
ncbi:DNA repair protein RAD16 [Coemansia erecta]|nr:DNA repair protein RAD16 [Coemansia erecta]